MEFEIVKKDLDCFPPVSLDSNVSVPLSMVVTRFAQLCSSVAQVLSPQA